ncbi:MAG: hypothetical protein JSV16_02195 [Candidatus Hydrogenedentota bacterium]|nr:MAG: hypothetical protein JSV16_02195 [Candidatus Hydrogenedentota bacterium]
MKTFAVLQLSGCAGCEVSLLDADAWVDEYQLAYLPLIRYWKMAALTFPLSRIEGHAQAVVEVQGGEAIRANSLARINMASTMGTPKADDYLSRFREAFGQPLSQGR